MLLRERQRREECKKWEVRNTEREETLYLMPLSSHLLSISDFRKPPFSQRLTYKLMGFYSVTFLENISAT